MNKETELTEALNRLRAEIGALDTADEISRRKVQALVEDLEKKIKSPEDREIHESLTEQLKDSVLHFEVSHPRLTAVMNDIMVRLGNMGI
jgi:hypothetical protein